MVCNACSHSWLLLPLLLLLMLLPEEFKSGGVYYLPVDTAPLPADAAINIRRQQEDAVIVRLQQSLLVQLGYGSAAGKCNDTDSLREQLNEMFKGELANRRHLLVVDGLWSQRMIEAFQIDSMKGAILATVSYWDDASGLTSVADAEAAWAGDELGVRQVHLQSDGDSRSTAQALLREYVSLNTQEKKVSHVMPCKPISAVMSALSTWMSLVTHALADEPWPFD